MKSAFHSFFTGSPRRIKAIPVPLDPLQHFRRQPPRDLERVAEAPGGDLGAALAHHAVDLDPLAHGHLQVVVLAPGGLGDLFSAERGMYVR